jgi:hypothetical protein
MYLGLGLSSTGHTHPRPPPTPPPTHTHTPGRWFPKVLKTRDPLVFSCGWRRWQALPVFALEDHNRRCALRGVDGGGACHWLVLASGQVAQLRPAGALMQ